MRKILLIVTCAGIFFLSQTANSQIITPVIKARFGIEADLKSNFFNGFVQPGNDDWFPDSSGGSGIYLIDTTGAAAIVNEYKINPAYRKNCFTRPMTYPVYSIVNNKFLYDAIYVRDHYKNDSTAFASSNKNGQSPGLWTGGVTPVPDKSDLNDVMVHVRRDGPLLSDSLWFFAGLSLHGNTGNRYFDFELYQSDVYYNSADNKFYNYGPDAGHTAWQFDAAGNVLTPGDVIFTAEFGSSSLTLLEARIWVHQSATSLTPTQFNWGGAFDGDGGGAQYGYATILPKTSGNFYSGMQSAANTWAGPFGFVDVTDILQTNYEERYYMEIAVNMTKIGLDPYSLLGTSGCNLSFRRFFAKTRSSTSFTSELKDFVGPYRIARPAPALAIGDSAMFCGREPDSSLISVNNPILSSEYTWTTLNGNIVTSPATGPSIIVDKPGTYIVTQTLFSGCAPYARDTVTLVRDTAGCLVLSSLDLALTGTMKDISVLLRWQSQDKSISQFEIERSTDGTLFRKTGTVMAASNSGSIQHYTFNDLINRINSRFIYYRLKATRADGEIVYSRVIHIKNTASFTEDFVMLPNPASDYIQVIAKGEDYKGTVRIFNSTGIEVLNKTLNSENEKISLEKLPPGIYLVNIASADSKYSTKKKLLVAR